MSRMSNMLEGGCPPPPEISELEKNDYAAELADKMGIQSCNTTSFFQKDESNWDASGGMEVNLGLGGLLPSAEAKFETSGERNITTNTTSAIGCETLTVMSEKVRQATSNVSCLLNKSSKTDTLNMRAGNAVIFKAEDGGILTVNCAGAAGGQLKIQQDIQMKVVFISQMSDEEVNEITKQVDSAIKDVVDVMKNQDAGLNAVVQGSKTFSDKISDITSDSYQSSAKENIKKFEVKLTANNDIEFIARGGVVVGDRFYPSTLNITAGQCNFTQNMVIDLLAQNIVESTFIQTFDDLFKTDVDTMKKVEEENIVRGLDDLDMTSNLAKRIQIKEEGKTARARLEGSGWGTYIAGFFISCLLVAGGYYAYTVWEEENKKKKKL